MGVKPTRRESRLDPGDGDHARRAVRQHHPHALDGRGPEGQLRPPRHADGARAGGLPALHARDAPLAGAPGLACARPLRAVGRPRVDAPVLDPPPDRLRRLARRPQELPPARLADRRPPRVRPRAGDRDHHRAARPGHLDLGRDGARRAHAGRPLRRGDGRPLHVRDRLRRRPRGGHRLRGQLARRPPRPRPPDRLLRRQPHLDRGRHGARLLRGRRQALRGLRLARAEPRRGHRARQPGARRRGGQGETGPAEHDHHPDAHRARLAEQAGHARGARLAARRGGDPAHQAGLRLAQRGAVLRPRRGAGALPRVRRPRARAGGRVGRALPRPRRARPDAGAAPARRLGRRRAQEGPGRRHDRHAQGLQRGHPVGGGAGPRAGRRLGRPRSLDADPHQRRGKCRGR